MASKKTKIQEQIERATDRLARLKARQMVKDERERARERARARREDAHRKIKLGGLVIAAECAHFGESDEATLVGMLLDARQRANSAEYRAQARERGIQHLVAREAARGGRRER